MFMTTVDLSCDGAIQITASHHPWNKNGLKIFLPSGGVEGSDVAEILELAQTGSCPDNAEGQVVVTAYMDQYAARLRRQIIEETGGDEKPLSGLRIVVDAGNGAGGFYAGQVLEPLGADISGSQFLEPDGRFPNHIPNPENPQAMSSICEAVIRTGADLGVIFDTDVDRAGCVGPDGREINRNRLIALAAAIALEGNKGGTIVTDSITSTGLNYFIESVLGGVHCRFKRGYKNVINESRRLNAQGINSPLAIETSGHAALRENYFLDDGAYLVTKIISKAVQLHREGKTLCDLIVALPEPAESFEHRFTITETDFRAYGERVLKDLETYAREQRWDIAEDNHEGLRVSFGKEQGDGWFLLRLSVHDPVMPLNVESNREGGCALILKQLAPFMKKQQALVK
jgi:phosphomannomutase